MPGLWVSLDRTGEGGVKIALTVLGIVVGLALLATAVAIALIHEDDE